MTVVATVAAMKATAAATTDNILLIMEKGLKKPFFISVHITHNAHTKNNKGDTHSGVALV